MHKVQLVEQFQFLIGTIKTLFHFFHSSLIILVSIPYRYYKNQENQQDVNLATWVSIPYRYYKNFTYEAKKVLYDYCFNSL